MALACLLAECSGWVLLVALVWAPWVFASQPPWSARVLTSLLLSAVILWVASCVISRRFPRLPLVCTLCVLVILTQGWWMYFNAHGTYDAGTGAIATRLAPVPALPGTVERAVTGEMMSMLTAILGALLMVCALVQEPAWPTRLWWTICLAGSTLVAFGIIERTGLTAVMTDHMLPHEGIPFGSFNYHGTAGSFINLLIPAVLGLAMVPRSSRRGFTVFLMTMLATCLAGILINASRAAMALTPIVLFVFVLTARRASASQSARRARKRYLSVSFGVVILTALVLAAVTIADSRAGWRRWSGFGTQLSARSSRGVLWRICWNMCRDAGAFGMGPGTFKMLLPNSKHFDPELYSRYIVTAHRPGTRVSMWSNAHQDYLQTIVEWGWVGAAVWGVLVVGGIARLLRLRSDRNAASAMGKDPARLPRAVCLAALVGIYLHALVDFPLQVPSLQLYTACYLGVAWGASRTSQSKAAAASADAPKVAEAFGTPNDVKPVALAL